MISCHTYAMLLNEDKSSILNTRKEQVTTIRSIDREANGEDMVVETTTSNPDNDQAPSERSIGDDDEKNLRKAVKQIAIHEAHRLLSIVSRTLGTDSQSLMRLSHALEYII